MYSNPNSKAAANEDAAYKQIKRPDDPLDAIDAIDIWARYVHRWGDLVHTELHKPAYAGRESAAAVARTHLDPPPEPFST